ncbi:hypothetical protein PRIPAC_90014 [Pristionchus pacificus]|uniref:Uncharacterized protein n=1 Tax=Pristionchus pacificus TaxID=54126 RepID=A0A2A6CYC8_PRIPA|nr:hypothetical protein PRIPAC_90014 [Pristionchus pacificus]|eukprot:PDM83169.1 hypothetical protein PRIPAC_37562 [Pristionchus pacificus]
MGAEDEPEVFYEADDGRKISCTLREAQTWLYQGYFTSSTRFALRGRDGNEGEWTTLGELIARNGRAMPFSEWMSNEEEEELRKLREEIIKLNRQKESLEQLMEQNKERRTFVHQELDRIAQKLSDLDSPLKLPEVTSSTADDAPVEKASSAVLDVTQSVPSADIALRFKELRALFGRCDKLKLSRLMEETSGLCSEESHLKCNFCLVHLDTTNCMLYHIGSERHISNVEKSR